MQIVRQRVPETTIIHVIESWSLLYKLRLQCWVIDWLSMVLRLHQHNIGYTADGFYRSDDPTNSIKALKEGG